MAYIDISTFTKTDPSSNYTFSPDNQHVTVSSLARTTSARIYSDYGAGFFTTNWTLEYTINITAQSATNASAIGPLIASNVNTTNDLLNNWSSGDAVFINHNNTVNTTSYAFQAVIVQSGTISSGTAITLSALNTVYYIRAYIDPSVGTYGTFYVKGYSDSTYSTLIGTSSVALTKAPSFQYFFPTAARHASVTATTFSGVLGNYIFGAQIASVENGDTTSITASKSTMSVASVEAGDITNITAANLNLVISSVEGGDVTAVTIEPDISASVASVEGGDVTNIVGSTNLVASVASVEGGDVTVVNGGIPISGYVYSIEDGDTTSALSTVSEITETFSVIVRNKTTGAAITGLTTVYVKCYKPDTGYIFDFSDSTFKTSPTTSTSAMTEVNATTQAGLYRTTITTTNWSGWVEIEATYYDGSFTYTWQNESYYSGGVRGRGVWIPSEIAQINAISGYTQQTITNVAAVNTKLGPPAGASVSADIAEVKSLAALAAIK